MKLTKDQIKLLANCLDQYADHWYDFHNKAQRNFVAELKAILLEEIRR